MLNRWQADLFAYDLTSSLAPIEAAYDSSPVTVDVNRALELNSPDTYVTPRHREVMLQLLLLTDEHHVALELEQALFQQHHQLFRDYAQHGGRLLTLLSGATFVASLLGSWRGKLAELTDLSEEELVPELYDNDRLSERQFNSLRAELEQEYDRTIAEYTQLVLTVADANELDEYPIQEPADEELCVTDGERTYCLGLRDLLEQFARQDYTNPVSGQLYSEAAWNSVDQRYGAYIAVLQYDT